MDFILSSKLLPWDLGAGSPSLYLRSLFHLNNFWPLLSNKHFQNHLPERGQTFGSKLYSCQWEEENNNCTIYSYSQGSEDIK